MLLSDLIKNIEGIKWFGNKTDFAVSGISYNSKKVKKDNIFVSLKGKNDDGLNYIDESINNGCKAVLIDSESLNKIKHKEYFHEINILISDNVRKSMAELSCAYFDNPSSKMKLIGVTGTNGKTTVTYLLKSVFENIGHKCGIIGTIDYFNGNETIPATLTTPESWDINSMLSEMLQNGVSYCFMEVSSVALNSYRVYGLDFDVAVFTNLTSEHMDIHLNMNNYFLAKKILFDGLKKNSIAVSNADDDYGVKILNDTIAEKVFYSIDNISDYRATSVKVNINGLSFLINENISIESTITGRFNTYNILAAAAVSLKLGVNERNFVDSVKNFTPAKGRFNIIPLPNKSYAVIDYSHTSDSLKNAIEAALDIRKNNNSKGRIITLFGCGGNKDRTKRPVMGRIASELSDFVIVTSDNPRFEDPLFIIEEIKKGIIDKNNFITDPDREAAIKKGIEMTRENDILLICGKGHETYQEIKGIKNHFDDSEIVFKYAGLK